jgi:hypothetical protein
MREGGRERAVVGDKERELDLTVKRSCISVKNILCL